MNAMENNVELTATEISNIWASYMKNSMEIRFYEYFIEIIEDVEAKEFINTMLSLSRDSMDKIKEIFRIERLSIPYGFTNEDVRIRAPRVISDAFILAFCYDFTLLTIDTHSSALLISTRKDIRQYLHHCIDVNISAQSRLIDIMKSRGLYTEHPRVAIDNEIQFIDNKKYLSGLLTNNRSLNVAEIASLIRIIHRAEFSKMVFVAFSKITNSQKLEKHFNAGTDEIQKILNSLQPLLSAENIPISSMEDYKIFDIDVPPFSDKLMLFFINTCLGVYCSTMVSRAIASSLRTDITSKLLVIMKDMLTYYDDGIKLMIKNEWLEAPPQPIDTK